MSYKKIKLNFDDFKPVQNNESVKGDYSSTGEWQKHHEKCDD